MSGERLGAVGVVRGVEQEAARRCAGECGFDALETAGPADAREAARDRFRRRPDARAQLGGDASVVPLVIAVEPDSRVGDVRDSRRLGRRRRVRASDLVDRRAHVGRHGPEHEVETGLGDPRLLARDVDERGPQAIGVVERDARDRGGARSRQDVRRVEPAADAHLDDREVDLGVAKGEERGERRRLEERQLRRAVERALERPGERRVVDRLALDPDALGEAAEVRRGEQPRRCPAARAIDSTIAQTLPLPFVPATWTASKARSGCPKRAQASRIGSSPSRMPSGIRA